MSVRRIAPRLSRQSTSASTYEHEEDRRREDRELARDDAEGNAAGRDHDRGAPCPVAVARFGAQHFGGSRGRLASPPLRTKVLDADPGQHGNEDHEQRPDHGERPLDAEHAQPDEHEEQAERGHSTVGEPCRLDRPRVARRGLRAQPGDDARHAILDAEDRA